jgi:hypothetical protein
MDIMQPKGWQASRDGAKEAAGIKGIVVYIHGGGFVATIHEHYSQSFTFLVRQVVKIFARLFIC